MIPLLKENSEKHFGACHYFHMHLYILPNLRLLCMCLPSSGYVLNVFLFVTVSDDIFYWLHSIFLYSTIIIYRTYSHISVYLGGF